MGVVVRLILAAPKAGLVAAMAVFWRAMGAWPGRTVVCLEMDLWLAETGCCRQSG